jgi:hypothetical protein
MPKGSGGGGRPGRSGGGGGGGMPSQSDALEMSSNPEKLLSDLKKAKYGDFTAQDKAEYAKYVLDMKTAQTRNDAGRATNALMREKSKYGAAKKTYRGLEKDPAYSQQKAKTDKLYKDLGAYRAKQENFDRVFSGAGKRISGLNPYGPDRDIKVT